ncbi:Synaptosomal-associated protein 47 [Bagarius yarrelli]|uniref:Synaptosomal-associated protein 47 n=1 Tax=Bagarius yarrelli TaxID=175774 RepID=A0A556V9C1_BAGYA|nr:Synaptosomal-associated protein 47 [Bagarius yarrelli]
MDAPVHSWSCSYYVNSAKRWVSGRLTLTASAVRFSPSSGGEVGAVLLLPLSRVTHINTESSCFIFSAVTLQERDTLKHWFSSLKPSAGAVFHVLQHFWRETLAQHTHSTHTPLSRGQRLISMVSDTQHTLAHTGRALSQQGEQFQHMIHQLDKMESDLGVADKKCQSELSKADNKAPPPEGSARTSKEILSVPVVFYRGGDVNAADVNTGSLALLVSALELHDANSRLVYRFHKQEVDEIRVHGVCDISVRQRHIGKPDVCFRLLSAKMAEALCVLEVQYKKKVEFARDYSGFQDMSSDDITPGSMASCNAEFPAGDLPPVQLHVQQNAVSQEEAQELKQVLEQTPIIRGNLVLGPCKEQWRRTEKILRNVSNEECVSRQMKVRAEGQSSGSELRVRAQGQSSGSEQRVGTQSQSAGHELGLNSSRKTQERKTQHVFNQSIAQGETGDLTAETRGRTSQSRQKSKSVNTLTGYRSGGKAAICYTEAGHEMMVEQQTAGDCSESRRSAWSGGVILCVRMTADCFTVRTASL